MEGTYKVVEIDQYGGPLQIRQRQFRKLNEGEILVKVMCSTIHPADLMFLLGEYGGDAKPRIFPIVPGFEGSGVIVKGEGADPSLIGKRVSLGATFNKKGNFEGTWAEYYYTSPAFVLVFDKEIEYEKISFCQTNPLTALGFLDTLRKHNTQVVVQDAAFGALGKMFIRLCNKEGVKTINIVRKNDQIQGILSLGGNYAISTSEKGWEKSLAKIAKETQSKVFFDAVGGSLPGKILSLLPDESTMYHFGNLEVKKLGIDSVSLIFKKKKILGWWLLNWLKTLTPEQRKYYYDYVVNDIQSGSDLFLSKVSKTFSLDEIKSAVEYYTKNMSDGKIILKPKF
jgi:NADPH:quinone reductase-like Zn-dependent oxidoreductase